MQPGTTFGAPWGALLKGMTALTTLILVGIPLIGLNTGAGSDPASLLAMVGMPLSILLISSLFTIRGYVLTNDTIYVQRLAWETRVDLAGLQSVEADPEAMSKSVRTFGNGGLFCIAGRFRNRKLGGYHALATDPKRAVVLRLPGRIVVMTPDNPEAFVAGIKMRMRV